MLHQRAAALEVLAQGVSGATHPGVGRDQRPVAALVEGIEIDQLAGDVGGLDVPAGGLVDLDERGEQPV